MTMAQLALDLARRLKAGLSPAAAHCAELRSFRRGCMALLASGNNVWKQLGTT